MNSVHVLLVEDCSFDAQLVEAMLAGEPSLNFNLTRATRLADAKVLLSQRAFDVILTDLGLPDSQGVATFEELHKNAAALPIVVLSTKGDPDLALAAIQGGAQDFLPKTELSGLLLARTLRYAIERKLHLRQLEKALADVKTLSGLLPICASCRRVRDGKGSWSHLESYIAKHSDTSFSHGSCPACAVKALDAGGVRVPDAFRLAASE